METQNQIKVLTECLRDLTLAFTEHIVCHTRLIRLQQEQQEQIENLKHDVKILNGRIQRCQSAN